MSICKYLRLFLYRRQSVLLPVFVEPGEDQLCDVGPLRNCRLVQRKPARPLQAHREADVITGAPLLRLAARRTGRRLLFMDDVRDSGSAALHTRLLIHFHRFVISSAALPSSSNSVTASPLDKALANAVRC